MCCPFLFTSCFISMPCHWACERVVHFLLSLLSILSILSILSLHLSTPFQYFSPALLGIFSSFPDKHGGVCSCVFEMCPPLCCLSVSLCLRTNGCLLLLGQRSCPSHHRHLEKQTFTLRSSNVIPQENSPPEKSPQEKNI